MVQPFSGIDNPHSLMRIFTLPCAGDDQLWICVLDCQQRRDLPFKGLVFADVIGNLNIQFFSLADSYKINFFLIEHSYINLIASAKQLYGNDILQHMAVIHVLGTQSCVRWSYCQQSSAIAPSTSAERPPLSLRPTN